TFKYSPSAPSFHQRQAGEEGGQDGETFGKRLQLEWSSCLARSMGKQGAYTLMTQQSLPLMTFYSGWETYQQSLVEMIAPLSAEQLAFPAASHQWTIGMLAQHMVANRVWWFQV